MLSYLRPCAECGTEFRSYPSQKRRFCSVVCGRQFNVRLKAIPVLDRFWVKVNKDGPIPTHRPELGVCWIWMAAGDDKGYGRFGRSRPLGPVQAHRFIYEATYGPIESSKVLCCHHCDNRRCVRPDHLFLGTHADNTHDCISKNRFCSGDKHFSRAEPQKVLRGGDNGTAKLTEEQVREIMSRGSESGAALGREYGVSAALIYRIRKGIAWKHLSYA